MQLTVEREKRENALATLRRDVEVAKLRDDCVSGSFGCLNMGLYMHSTFQCKAEAEQVEAKLQQARDALMNVQNQNRTLQAAVDSFDMVSAKNQEELRHWKANVAHLEDEV